MSYTKLAKTTLVGASSPNFLEKKWLCGGQATTQHNIIRKVMMDEYEEVNQTVYFLSIDLEVDETEIEDHDEMMHNIKLHDEGQITWEDLFARGERVFGSIEDRGI